MLLTEKDVFAGKNEIKRSQVDSTCAERQQISCNDIHDQLLRYLNALCTFRNASLELNFK